MRKLLAALASVALVLVVLYPNAYLGVVQMRNETKGLESLVDADCELVALVGDYLDISGETPESWVLRNIQWQSDYDAYGNLEYWATPKETILYGRGDCEDRAILAKSLNAYLQKDVEIVVQVDHVYLVKDGENYFGVSDTEGVGELVKKIIVEMPLIRKIIITTGLIIIWGLVVYYEACSRLWI